MRHHGPTEAMAPSPSLYMDASRGLTNSCDLNTTSNVDANTNLNPPGVLATASAAISDSFSDLVPVLSRLNSSKIRVCSTPSMCHLPTTTSSPQRQPLSVCQTNDLADQHTTSVELDAKRRKRPKSRPRNLRPVGTDATLRNWHSLKLTIKRTSQAHKVHPTNLDSTATEVSNTRGDSSAPSDPPVDLTSDATVTEVDRKDASTSTTGSTIVTDPDPSTPCEPGTKVVVEGVVWLESTGMLVLNVQWRGRSYMGTLLDASRTGFGPSCVDKGITSALSLLTNRRSWARGSGRLGTRGLRRYSHHRRNIHTIHGRRDDSASVTTRSAAAARAARVTPRSPTSLATMSSDQASGSPTTIKASESQEQERAKLSVYDLDDCASSNNFPSGRIAQRGGKRRRRRGAGVGRSYRRVTPSSTALSDSPSVMETASDQHSTEPCDSSPPDKKPSFACLFPRCTRRFSDLISMRYHMTMGHIDPQKHSNTWSEQKAIDDPKIDPSCAPNEIESREPPSALNTHSNPTSPPKLSRVQSVNNGPCQDSDENSNSVHILSDDHADDDNRAPPRLHRIVSIPDVSTQMPNSSPTGNQLRPPSSVHGDDEPPAPSPAYSDISDDGTVPAEQNTSHLSSSASPGKDNINGLFPVAQPIISPLNLIPGQTRFMNGSPNVAYSPGPSLAENQSNLYLPVNLITAPRSTTTNNVPTVGLQAFGSPSGESRSNRSPKPLQPYLSATQPSYLVQTPLTLNTVIPLNRIPATSPSTPCIPGVNSFSVPPPPPLLRAPIAGGSLLSAYPTLATRLPQRTTSAAAATKQDSHFRGELAIRPKQSRSQLSNRSAANRKVNHFGSRT